MEASPLTQAHFHVTKAAQLTSSISQQTLTPQILQEASKEHSLAADLFAKSVDITSDAEAKRTLQLMRNHHRKLAQALSDAASAKGNLKVSYNGTGAGVSSPLLTRSGSPAPVSHSETPTLRRGGNSSNETEFAHGFPLLSHQPQPLSGLSNRIGKSTSSLLVSNLASKRGIPPVQNALSPVLSPATTPGTSGRRGSDFFTSTTINQTANGQGSGTVAPASSSTSKSTRHVQSQSRDTKQPEVGFNRFYTSLESFVSRIGSPLAGSLGFAGMDLVPESAESPTQDGELIDGSTVPAHSDKDGLTSGYGVTELVQNLMPKAWWSSQEQGKPKATPKGRGIFGGSGNARRTTTWQGGNESYYVVPQTKSGHSHPTSYAAIADRTTSPPPDSTEDYSPLRPKKTEYRRVRGPVDTNVTETIPEGDEGGGDGGNSSKTMEELILENQQLRHLTDTLSRRLHTWEVNARDSRAMLDRSLMLYRNKSGDGASFGAAGDDRSAEREKELQREIQTLNGKLADLEAELDDVREQLEREKKENERSTKKANYYKERWDKLKMDALAKEMRKQQELGNVVGAAGEGSSRTGGSRRASLDR
ncbi:hypothetical protein BDZ91DRAFT_26632 [Kalaharituber pfeilii]|nr:hypothetical protein BDZ91DRAFT_26632 [Kalaharituber pfeilii]